MSLMDIILVGAGGAIGSICRFCCDSIKMFSHQSTNTIAINLTGCLMIGILWAIFNRNGLLDSPAYRLLVTGLLGGFTTFSTFALQPMCMLRTGNITEAAIYVGISVVGGLALCWCGLYLTQKII